MIRSTWLVVLAAFGVSLTFPVLAKTVKVTPLGGIDGEFCPQDRALRFGNGLVVYLSGDTGIIADQELVVRNHYAAKLTVTNIGNGFATGPVEGSKTGTFTKAVRVPVHIPPSGKTMEFDAEVHGGVLTWLACSPASQPA